MLARFYGQQALVGITLALCIGTLSQGLSQVHLGLLQRQMRFGALMTIDMTATVLSIASAISLAIAGAGYWALVAQAVVLQTVQAPGLWLRCPWRPSVDRPSRHDPAMRALIRFGTYATITKFVHHLGCVLDSVLVGKLVGASALGLYSRAQLWALMPFRQTYFPLMGVAVSSLSRLQNDAQRYRHYVRTATLGLFSVVFAGMSLLFVKADDGVLLLLGRQWLDAIPLFRILTVGAAATSVAQVMRWLYLAEGRTRRNMQWTFILTAVFTAGAAAGSAWGAVGVASGVSAAAWLLVVPALLFCLRESPVSLGDILRALWRPAAASCLASLCLAVIEWLVPQSELLLIRLLVAAGIFLACYVCSWRVFPGGAAGLNSLMQVARHARTSR